MWNEILPFLEKLSLVLTGAVTTRYISKPDKNHDILVTIELDGIKLMGIIADLQLIVSVLKEVDTVMASFPQNAEIVSLKAKLDSALAVIEALGL